MFMMSEGLLSGLVIVIADTSLTGMWIGVIRDGGTIWLLT
jgi:hypothetical protein